jgi:predicted permease
MSWLGGLRQRLREVFTPGRDSRDVEDELRDHFEREVRRQLREGAAPDDARRRAVLRAGNLAAAADAVRDERSGRVLADALSDLRLAARTARRHVGFTAAVAASFALGVGGTTAVFGIVHATLLRPLPYADAGRLAVVRIWWNDFSARLSPADMNALQEHGSGIAVTGAFFRPDDGFAMTTEAGPELIDGAIVTDTLTRVLGVHPIAGPGFSTQPNAPEALIGDTLSRSRYGGPNGAVGKSIVIDDDAYTIVGVMPAGFDVPGQRGASVWLKALSRPSTRRGPFYFYTVARVAPGLTIDAAAGRLTAAVAPVLQDRFAVEPDWRYGLVPLRQALVGDLRRTLLLLFGAMAFVLLIAIVNVANLMLARGTVRTRELAVRASLGAGRGRLARHLLAESVLLGALGGAAGLACGWLFLDLVGSTATRALPALAAVRFEPVLVAFALAAGIGAALLASLVPLVKTPWGRLGVLLRDGGRGTIGAAGSARIRQALVVIEVALTVTVLTGAALLGRSLARLQAVDPGFAPDGRASFRLTLPDAQYPDDARRSAFISTLTERLRANPGVDDAAVALSLPPDLLALSNNYTIEGSAPGSQGAAGIAEWNVVSGGYFDTMGIRLVDGRPFTPADRAGAPRAAIVNETFARRHFPTGPAIGARFRSGDWDPGAPWTTIVGVAADVPYGKGLWGGADATVYVPHAQNPWLQSFYVVVSARGDPAGALRDARQTVRSLDAGLPLRDAATMRGRLHDSLTEPRLRALVFVLIAGLALALAVTGIYGVMAYHVQQRQRETAIRLALGATARDVVGGTVGMGLRLTLAGIVLGTLGAMALTRTLSAVLFQVTPRDPGSFALSAALLVATAALACGLPALRSARIDPSELLREDA